MTNEFTAYSNLYYQLTMLLSEQEEYVKTLLDNAPIYCGQTRLSEIDAIISYYREAQAEKAKIVKTHKRLNETGHTILTIMRHFEIPPGTVLTGEMPGEAEYKIWADEDEAIHISQIKELAPEVDNPNIMVIKFSGF